jgi:hypothetical protein
VAHPFTPFVAMQQAGINSVTVAQATGMPIAVKMVK